MAHNARRVIRIETEVEPEFGVLDSKGRHETSVAVIVTFVPRTDSRSAWLALSLSDAARLASNLSATVGQSGGEE